MRILSICNVSLADANAGPIHVRAIAEGLARRGHEVHLLAPAGGKLSDPLPFTVSYLPVAFGRGHDAAAFNLALAGALPPLLARFRPHALYVREWYRCLTPALVPRTPLVLEVNGILADELRAVGARIDRATPRLMRFVYRRAAHVIAVTDGIRAHLLHAFEVPPARVTVLANGVDVRAFRPMDRACVRRVLGLGGAPVVGFIGNLEVWQGVDALLSAVPHVLARRPDTRFLLVGGGPREHEYRARARALGIAQAVHFTGPMPVADSPRWINAFDVAVTLKQPLASGYSPLKLYAYLACGRPIVASRLPGLEPVEEAGAGLLVPHDNPAAAAGAILRLLERPHEAAAMGVRGRALAEARYSWDHVVVETERVLRAVVRGVSR